ncbi:DUF2254 domain-containing protein [Ensifer soli]|uniref:DUF2254 domain-containing protein n=1 Tax=Ciceribacter sp. sgz301302 TaxID=3342379 RepID=UPI0035B98216
MSKWQWMIGRLLKRLWLRPALFALAGLFTALFSVFFSPSLPLDFGSRIGADAVDNILNILASSMLAVTTFSLSTMVTAYGAATTNVTPRATTLVVEDTTTQNVLATFIGTFLFSLVGIVALSTGAYGEEGRGILFLVTLVVIAIIIVTMLRWIDHLSRLGRVGDTIDRVERAAMQALMARAGSPHLGGVPAKTDPAGGVRLYLDDIGYLQHLDIGTLNRLAENHQLRLQVLVLPGAYVDPSRTVLWLPRELHDDDMNAFRAAFTVGVRRSFEQDPRFGLSVLSEIASRALSPAVNDPGTAIDVLSRSVRLFHAYSLRDDHEIVYPLVAVPGLNADDLFDDFFLPIARDGASLVEVHIRLQKTLQAVGYMSDSYRIAARRQSRLAQERAEIALQIESDKRILRTLVIQ